MSNVHMTCVRFLTLCGFFRGNFKDKLLEIYFFFSNLLSLESKGKVISLHWCICMSQIKDALFSCWSGACCGGCGGPRDAACPTACSQACSLGGSWL